MTPSALLSLFRSFRPNRHVMAADRTGGLRIHPVISHAQAAIPLMAHLAMCGFPSPADDYLDRPLDFNELLIENPAATFAVRVAGDSMIGAGIFPGDIAIVNRARKIQASSLVLHNGRSRSSGAMTSDTKKPG